MKRTLFLLALLTMNATAAVAEVNCDQVRRYAQTGRTPEDIADTMIIDLNEVKKCLEGASAPTPGAEKSNQ